LVTCTLGEEGEIHVPALARLEAAQADQLGGYRLVELERACAALGVTDHRFLGGAGRWRDSGMMGEPTNDDPRCFWRADVEEAAAALLDVVRDVRPQVIVSYDANGFYGHPDHIQAHRVAMRAFGKAGGLVRKMYANTVPKSVLVGMVERMRGGDPAERPAAGTGFTPVQSAGELPFGVPDEVVTTEVDATAYLDNKLNAMRAHATQITVDSPFYALSNNLGVRAFGVEYYILLAGERGPAGSGGREADLFAGID